MHVEWNIVRSFLLGFAGGSIGGAITGAVAGHIFAKRRDQRNRRLDFLEFIGGFRTGAYLCRDDPKAFPEYVASRMAEFGGKYVALERDLWFWKRRRFHRLCDDMVAMTKEQARDAGDVLDRLEKITALA